MASIGWNLKFVLVIPLKPIHGPEFLDEYGLPLVPPSAKISTQTHRASKKVWEHDDGTSKDVGSIASIMAGWSPCDLSHYSELPSRRLANQYGGKASDWAKVRSPSYTSLDGE